MAAYVEHQYEKALNHFQKAAKDSKAQFSVFGLPIQPLALMRMGNMQDLLNRREEAHSAYRAAEEALPPGTLEHLPKKLAGYLAEPFERPAP